MQISFSGPILNRNLAIKIKEESGFDEKIRRLCHQTASDENYAPYLNVMMTTVLENCHAERSVHFYVIDDGLSLSSKKALQETVSSNSQNATVEFLTADKEVYQNFLVSDHITTTAYLRISLPSLLQKYSYKRFFI